MAFVLSLAFDGTVAAFTCCCRGCPKAELRPGSEGLHIPLQLQPPAPSASQQSKDGDPQERRQPEVAMGRSKGGASVPRDAFVKCIISVDVGDGVNTVAMCS